MIHSDPSKILLEIVYDLEHNGNVGFARPHPADTVHDAHQDHQLAVTIGAVDVGHVSSQLTDKDGGKWQLMMGCAHKEGHWVFVKRDRRGWLVYDDTQPELTRKVDSLHSVFPGKVTHLSMMVYARASHAKSK